MNDFDKVKRETKRVAGQANEFEFKPVHVVIVVIVVGLAIYGGLKVAGVL
jgi:hypothetical protein